MSRGRTARTGALIALLGGLAAYFNARRLSTAGGTLRSGIPGDSHLYNWRGWKVFYNKRGNGRPLVLLHGIYATASNREMRRIFEPFSHEFTVYAPDLIGFGQSARPALEYSDKLYITMLRDFLRDVVGPGALVIASSLTATYAIEVAAREPSLISRLVLIEPTGLTTLAAKPTPAERLFFRALRVPLIGDNFFYTLTSRASLRNFLELQVYFDKSFVTDALVEEQYKTSHQPGAKWAPVSFVTGRLNHNVRFTFPLLRCPVLVMRGAESHFGGEAEVNEFASLNPNAEFHQIQKSGSLIHDEQATAFHAVAREWLMREMGESRSA